MSSLFAPPRYSPMSGNGTSYPAAKLYFYITGTTTPKNTYSDPDLDPGHANANPVVADANGLFGPIYMASGDYKVILKDSLDNTIWTVDPMSGLGAADALAARGSLLTRDASGYKELLIGSAGQVLGSNGTDPLWVTPVVPRGSIQGLTYANNSTDAINDIDIAVGSAMDATNTVMLVLAAALTKKSDAAWVVGNNQGALDDIGSAGSHDFFIWLISRSDTGVVDVLFSLSATAPTMPTNYNYKRLIGWFKREAVSFTGSISGTTLTVESSPAGVIAIGDTITGAGVTASTTILSGGGMTWTVNNSQTVSSVSMGIADKITPFFTYETAGGGIDFTWKVPTLDVDQTNTLTSSGRTDAIKVPLVFSTVAKINALISDAASPCLVWIHNPDQPAVAPSDSFAPLANMALVSGAGIFDQRELRIRTSADGKIGAISNLATVDEYKVATIAFEYHR